MPAVSTEACQPAAPGQHRESTPGRSIPTAGLDIGTLLTVHEERQTLLARVAYSLLRLTAAVPSSVGGSVADAARAAQQGMAWLAGSATNPGRWASRSVLITELAELDELLAVAHGHLTSVLSWLDPALPDQSLRSDQSLRTLRLPRSLASECEALVVKLAREVDPVAGRA